MIGQSQVSQSKRDADWLTLISITRTFRCSTVASSVSVSWSWGILSTLEIGFITAPLGPVPGLGRIFDTTCETLNFGPRSVEGSDSQTDEASCLKLVDAPKETRIVEVDCLHSATLAVTPIASEARRGKTEWLVVHVRSSTTAVLLFPQETHCYNLVRRLAIYMEWLEAAGMSQVLVALPIGEETLLRSLLFLGFSRIPRMVMADQLPDWCDSYTLFITDFTEA